jgi:dihydrofolate synthase/folylpolyglutamate synthase
MFHRIGPAAFRKDLTNINAFCEHLLHPERQFECIHVAGTNGKGSVSHILAAVFTASGLKTGLYTSPHYKDFRERIKIDGQLIPKKEVADFVEKHRDFCESLRPSYFEWTVALAFDFFARQQVDIAIIETGLGGRIDSTNIVNPMLSVITNIGYDHMNLLGDTLELIAGEKAGIIKPAVPVVIGETHPQTREVFLKTASQRQAPLVFADQHWQLQAVEKTDTHVHYLASNTDRRPDASLWLNHLGDYQQKNLCTVLQALDSFEHYHPGKIPAGGLQLALGLSRLKQLSGLIGRWEFINLAPRVLCDSAHNVDGIREALAGLSRLSFDKLHIIFGTVNDKPPAMVLSLLPREARYYFAKAKIPRGMEVEMLKAAATELGLQGKAYTSVRRALSAAKKSAAAEDLILVCGSIFVVAEVL